MKWDVRTLTRVAVLAAVSSVLYMIEIPVVAFYKLDLSNMPALLGGFAMGPLAGVLILLVKDLTGLLHSSTGGIGEIADLLMGAALLLPAVLVYRAKRSRFGAIIGMLIGTVAIGVAGVLTNYYILIPMFTAFMPMEAIIAAGAAVIPAIDTPVKLVLLITLPFNLLKGIVLSAVTFVLYKPLAPLLHDKRADALN